MQSPLCRLFSRELVSCDKFVRCISNQIWSTQRRINFPSCRALTPIRSSMPNALNWSLRRVLDLLPCIHLRRHNSQLSPLRPPIRFYLLCILCCCCRSHLYTTTTTTTQFSKEEGTVVAPQDGHLLHVQIQTVRSLFNRNFIKTKVLCNFFKTMFNYSVIILMIWYT